MKKSFLIMLVITILISSIFPIENFSKTKQIKNGDNKIQRTPIGFFDNQKNTQSNIEFYTTNYGIFGHDVIKNNGGCFWPRDSIFQYLWGGGFWFGTQRIDKNDTLKKYVDISYNTQNGASYFTPGRVEDGLLADTNEVKKYRVYFSRDFNSNDGIPVNITDGPNWPIWKTDNNGNTNKDFGFYINEINERNLDKYPKGPVFISDEDIFLTYKDTDISFTDDSSMRKFYGYPLGIQVEQIIYTWKSGVQKDFIIQYYKIINFSNDTLYNSFFGQILDPDIGRLPYVQSSNGRADFYSEGDTFKLGYSWGNISNDIYIPKYGYLGLNFLMTPAVDENYYIRKDKLEYNLSEQLGLKTYFHFNIEDELPAYEDKYNLMASLKFDHDDGPGDKRISIVTGPFHMLPNDTAKFVIFIGMVESDTVFHQIIPNSTQNNYMTIVDLAKYAQQFYKNNMISSNNELIFNNNHFIFYPNPASDIINISSNSLSNIERIELYNLLGEKIIERNEMFSSEYKLNTRYLQNGSYFLRIKSGNNIESKLLQIAK